jgi:death-on-curing protein
MSEPRWLTLEEVMIAQEKQLKAFGGPAGVRDQGALESALSRPINRYHYGDFDLAVLAASLAFGLARNHAFVDGNKRIVFVATLAFLRLNGVRFAPDPKLATAMYVALAAGEVSEESLARWIRDNWPEAALGQA